MPEHCVIHTERKATHGVRFVGGAEYYLCEECALKRGLRSARSEALRRYWATRSPEERRAHLPSQALSQSPESRAKRSASWTPEMRAAQSERHKRKWREASPEKRARMAGFRRSST
jgi:hypothetical protein